LTTTAPPPTRSLRCFLALRVLQLRFLLVQLLNLLQLLQQRVARVVEK
jgi:hypothetical protein